MELVKDYDLTIQYDLGNVNMVANTLSLKLASLCSLTCLGCLATLGQRDSDF